MEDILEVLFCLFFCGVLWCFGFFLIQYLCNIVPEAGMVGLGFFFL